MLRLHGTGGDQIRSIKSCPCWNWMIPLPFPKQETMPGIVMRGWPWHPTPRVHIHAFFCSVDGTTNTHARTTIAQTPLPRFSPTAALAATSTKHIRRSAVLLRNSTCAHQGPANLAGSLKSQQSAQVSDGNYHHSPDLDNKAHHLDHGHFAFTSASRTSLRIRRFGSVLA